MPHLVTPSEEMVLKLCLHLITPYEVDPLTLWMLLYRVVFVLALACFVMHALFLEIESRAWRIGTIGVKTHGDR